jgi:hypothetical protein
MCSMKSVTHTEFVIVITLLPPSLSPLVQCNVYLSYAKMIIYLIISIQDLSSSSSILLLLLLLLLLFVSFLSGKEL